MKEKLWMQIGTLLELAHFTVTFITSMIKVNEVTEFIEFQLVDLQLFFVQLQLYWTLLYIRNRLKKCLNTHNTISLFKIDNSLLSECALARGYILLLQCVNSINVQCALCCTTFSWTLRVWSSLVLFPYIQFSWVCFMKIKAKINIQRSVYGESINFYPFNILIVFWHWHNWQWLCALVHIMISPQQGGMLLF